MNDETPGLVREDAFHVTAAANLPSIAAQGFQVDRRGVLGSGAYFDLGTEATGWAPARARYPEQPLVVFRCEILMGRVLDLDDDVMRSHFRSFQRTLVRRLGRDAVLKLGQGGHVEFFLRLLSDAGESYDTVKRTFATDGRTRIAVREAWRIRVISVYNEQGEELVWPPREG
jgi:hypothetical protein